jgi:transposase-like protein
MSTAYSEEFKNAMIQKMSGPLARSATALSEEVGIPQSTLSRWLRDRGRFEPRGKRVSNKKGRGKWSAEEKLQAVIAYDGLEEAEQGTYLRSRGLYSVDIERWRDEMLEALQKKPKKGDPKDRRIRDLERELRRKEQALAETAALLVLKKKAQEIWGEHEDEQ